MKRLCALLIAIGVLAAAAADDLAPPTWRGEPGSTYQHWSFDDVTYALPLEIYPEQVNNPYGDPFFRPAHVMHSEGMPEHLGRTGVVFGTMGEWFDIYTPNNPETNDYTYMVIQITWLGDPLNFGWISSTPTILSHTSQTLSDGWHYDRIHCRYDFSPDHEWFEIYTTDDINPTSVFLDQIVIDTLSIPEPSSLGLLLLAVVLGARRRR